MIYGISLQSEDWFNNAFLKTIFEKFMVYSDGKIEVIIKIDANYEEKFQVPKYTNILIVSVIWNYISWSGVCLLGSNLVSNLTKQLVHYC